ncbi:MAG: GMP synthase, partial [Bacteroidia bacterium]|nr:GMP synthase [Bacteroidia bacterium]
MSWTEKRSVRIAILDLYEGKANQGMRCIREIIQYWSKDNNLEAESVEFDVRLKNELPDTSFDIYISSGGPGDPLLSRFEDWDIAWCKWVDEMQRWNNNPSNNQKK